MEKVKKMEHPWRRRESRGIGSLKRRMLQFLKMERISNETLGTSKEEETRMDACIHSKQIESALFEAERIKAEALMNWERHRVIC